MANVLDELINDFYQAIDVVSREMVGFIPAVTLNASAERAAKDQPIIVPVTQSQQMVAITPGVNSPDDGDQTIDHVEVRITESYAVPIRWNGEQQMGMRNAGTYESVFGQQAEQAIRTLVNGVEATCFNAAYKAASRAYGTAGTAPFGVAGDLSDVAQVRKGLDDNGAPQSDLHLVLGSAAVANLRGKQSILLKANEAGSASFRQTGAISEIPLDGFMLHNSAAIRQVTKGAGTSYVTDGATAVGVNEIAVKTGSGTVLAGDVVTFAADTNNKYVVNKGVTAPGTLTIGEPGARVAIADGNAMTIGGSYTPNVAFSRNAIQLVTRAPARPTASNGRSLDAAIDSELVTDPRSGLTFELSVYPQFYQTRYQVALAWGAAAVKSEHIFTLIG